MKQSAACSSLLRPGLADLGYVGGGMPTTDEEAKAFAANVADPVKHLNDCIAASEGIYIVCKYPCDLATWKL